MITRDRLYINGQWLHSESGETLEVISPASGEVIGIVPNGTTADADRAVDAACAAFPAWSATPVSARAEALRALAEGLADWAEEIATTVTREVGTPIERSRPWQAAQPAHVTGLYARLVQSYPFEETVANSIVVREPIGPAVGIAPWNFPLHQAMLKVAPALAAGCTVILKPSSLSPLNAFILADIVAALGLPPGVFNLVAGPGATVGERLAAHPGVAMVSLTGSTEAGRRVAALAAQTVKRVTLELGRQVRQRDTPGRRPGDRGPQRRGQLLRERGPDLRRMDPHARTALIAAGGGGDRGGHRAGLPARRSTGRGHDDGPADLGRSAGPGADAHRQGRRGRSEAGHRRVRAPAGAGPGFFVRPTVFSEVQRGMLIAREEIFGPVLCIMPYRDEDEAVAIANDTMYGLHGGVWSADPARAMRVARRLQTGRVDINGAAFNYEAPFGGYKQSGTGRELGTYGLEEFLELKAIST